ncbi:MAG TPA: HNH endonuclease, partial [Trueperaceae bacterium]|nr:HNH endonuclease [Trueperaceae bacterium]
DPELKKQGIVGLTNASKLDREVWNEFNHDWEKLAFQSESLIAKFLNKNIEEVGLDEPLKLPEGLSKTRLVKTRVNQAFFRRSVLSAYNSTCCVTGLKIPQLLIASHIIPWSKANNKTEKTNPQNGICINALHDRAFDQGYMTITPDYMIKVSEKLFDIQNNKITDGLFKNIMNKNILLPNRFLPKREFLEYHNRYIFKD